MSGCQFLKIFPLTWSPVPHSNSTCHSVCQPCLKPPLRQGAWEVHSISGVSNTECIHLRAEPHQDPGRSPSCSPGHGSHRVEGEGTDRSRVGSRTQTFGTTGRGKLSRRHTERCPPYHHPEVFLSMAPALHCIQILCSVNKKQLGWRQPFYPAMGPRGRWDGRAGGPRRAPR